VEALVFPTPQCFSPNVQCAYHGYMHTTHYTLHMHTIFPLLLLLLLLLLPRPHDGTFLRHSADIQKNVSRRMIQEECLKMNVFRRMTQGSTILLIQYSSRSMLPLRAFSGGVHVTVQKKGKSVGTCHLTSLRRQIQDNSEGPMLQTLSNTSADLLFL